VEVTVASEQLDQAGMGLTSPCSEKTTANPRADHLPGTSAPFTELNPSSELLATSSSGSPGASTTAGCGWRVKVWESEGSWAVPAVMRVKGAFSFP
jgi:hypothetical protein